MMPEQEQPEKFNSLVRATFLARAVRLVQIRSLSILPSQAPNERSGPSKAAKC